LNLSYFSEAYVNGTPVSHGHLLAGGDHLEFLLRFGFKGAGIERPEVVKARGLLACYPELLRIGEEVKAKGLSTDESVEVTLALVVQFIERKFGPVPASEAPTLSRVIEMLTRIEGKIEALPHEKGRDADGHPLSIKQASKAVNLSESHLRRAIARAELCASNVGTVARPLWRIIRADLYRWLESKKGGHPQVPPRSDLKDLIRRHLPDL
jgi:hypothetical protein